MKSQVQKKLERLLNEVLLTSEFAWWDWDITKNLVTCNDLKVTMLGYDPADFKGAGYQAYTSLLHPEDHERTMQAMRDHLEGRAELYQVDYRIKKADGTYTWYMDRGAIMERSSSGEPLRLRGIVMDLGPAFREEVKDDLALAKLRQLLPVGKHLGIISICAGCKRFNSGGQKWLDVDEHFLKAVSEDVSHSICPDCLRRLYPEIADEILKR